jgi:hypothetical protein
MSVRSIRSTILVIAAVLSAVSASTALAQIQSVDPDAAIDGDLYGEQDAAGNGMPVDGSELPPVSSPPSYEPSYPATEAAPPVTSYPQPAVTPGAEAAPTPADPNTYQEDDLIGAAQGVFGKGAQGLAGVIEDILKKQGQPNGYIVGREAGGAIAIGLRYGSGTLHHKVEGTRPVYWTGPSIGFDAGANAADAFILVYNLYDSQELYKRFGQGEGQAYLVGGFNVSYLRRGDVVLIPVRVGAGLRLGANVGYMKFSENQRWLPF